MPVNEILPAGNSVLPVRWLMYANGTRVVTTKFLVVADSTWSRSARGHEDYTNEKAVP